MGIVERSSGEPGPAGSVFGEDSGKIRFIEKPWVLDVGGGQVAKRSSDPRVAYPESKFRYGT